MLVKPGEKHPPFVPVLSGKNSDGETGTFLASYVEFETKSEAGDEGPVTGCRSWGCCGGGSDCGMRSGGW